MFLFSFIDDLKRRNKNCLVKILERNISEIQNVLRIEDVLAD